MSVGTVDMPPAAAEPLFRAFGLGARSLKRERAALLLASAGTNLLALALPIFILQIYDRVLPNHALTTLGVLEAGLAVALLIDLALRTLRARVATWHATQIEHRLRVTGVERLLRAPLAVSERETPGVHMERMNAIGAVREFHASQLLLVLVDLPFAALFLGLIAWLAGRLVLVPLGLLLAFALSAAWLGRALRHGMEGRAAVDRRRFDFLIEALAGIHTVKALAVNARLERRHERLQEESALAMRHVTYLSTMAQTLGGLFSTLNTVLLVVFGAMLVLDGRISTGTLAASTLLAGRALQPLQSAMSLWTGFQAIRLAERQVQTVLRLPDEAAGRTERPPLVGALALEQITWRAEDGAAPLLDRVSLAVAPGQIVAIEGDTGAGKTTLMLLLAGVLQPERGIARIDGHDLKRLDPAWVRSHVAVLPQSGAIYAGTVLDNLTNFRLGECVNEALYLAYLLGLDEAIKRLPDGFESRLSSGEALPAGIRQRIAIVRELVKQPKAILFDDADRALDADAKQRLAMLLRAFGTKASVVIVSGDPVLLALAQRRYRLAGGRLTETDPRTGRARVQEVLS